MSAAKSGSRGAAIVKQLRRGFTLVELMIVVAIVGVLAVIALVGYNKYTRSAAAGEARAMLLSIRGAEDNYKTEVLTYQTCGDPSDGTTYYPQPLSVVKGQKNAWINTGNAQYQCWAQLNVRSTGPVRFSFAVKSGPPGPMNLTAPPNTPAGQWPFDGTPQSADPWFVASAAGDYDGDGIYSILFTSSGQSEVTVVDDTE
jgi:type IV pilus assembly protein PilA